MAKKSYTEVVIEVEARLSVLETHIPHVQNHLANIDQHLNKLNERTGKTEGKAAVNSSAINRIYWLVGGLFTVAGTIFTLIVTGVF